MDGYPCFVFSILGVGLLTAIIGDVASHIGCNIGLKDSVNAILFVALGTSIPGKGCLLAMVATTLVVARFRDNTARIINCCNMLSSVVAVSLSSVKHSYVTNLILAKVHTAREYIFGSLWDDAKA